MRELRSSLYQYLAEALGEPPDWLALPGKDWPLYQAAVASPRKSTGIIQALEAMRKIGEETPAARLERYRTVFSESTRFGIAIYESGSLSGRLLTEDTFAVERWYAWAGLKIKGAEMPDHACLELAFLSQLSGAGSTPSPDLEADFLQKHASRWLPAFGNMLAATGDLVYAPVGQFLCAWLGEICVELRVPGYAKARAARPPLLSGRLPFIVDMSSCTLCSFCVPACPARALSIQEDEHETALLLSTERCSGCGKCTSTCPTKGLSMRERHFAIEESGKGKLTLMRSPRVKCRRCGSLMVSQAEIEYVAACLNHAGWLDCCPNCRSIYPA